MPGLGRMLIGLGLLLLLIGVFVSLVGRLPGDIVIKKEHFTLYFPLTTSIVLSLLVSLLFYLFNKFF